VICFIGEKKHTKNTTDLPQITDKHHHITCIQNTSAAYERESNS